MSDVKKNIEHFPYTTEDVKRIKETVSFPKMMVLNTTYLCNARCPACPYTNSEIRKEERAVTHPDISESVFKTIADQAGKFKATVRVSGAGEPLMNRKIVDYIEYAKQKGCAVGLITNGSLLTEEKARRILACGTEMIEFSVDAADAKTYSVVREGLDFNRTVENIKACVRIRKELNAKTNIIASVVNQKAVAGKIEQIVSFWDKIVDKVQVRKFLTWNINDLEDSGDVTPYLAKDAPCPFPFDRMLVDTNGDIRFCVYDIKGVTTWGNVLDQSISDIWRSREFQNLREIHINREFDKFLLCRNCLDRQFRSWSYNYFSLREGASEQRSKIRSDH